MPDEPSLGLGILKARLNAEQIPCRVHHLSLQLLRHLSIRTYVTIGNAFAVNDFVFSHILDPHVNEDQLTLLHERAEEMLWSGDLSVAQYPDAASVVNMLLTLRQSVIPEYLESCAAAISSYSPTCIGFTCLFDQTVSSLAMAKLLRESNPGALIGMGGYALTGPLASHLVDTFPWIDFVAEGEGENLITLLASASIHREKLQGIPSLRLRNRVGHEPLPEPPVAMDTVPHPDYSGFFDELKELELHDKVLVAPDTLPVEASRGCWWGQLRHCVFCGIDDESLKYRSKSPERVIAMLESVSSSTGVRKIRFNDYILPYKYFETLLPALTQLESGYVLSCESKANLGREQFETLRSAGFIEIQPGIESFSTSVLRRMDKGVTATRNILALVLGRVLGVTIHYNLLYGFPDDRLEDYRKQLTIVPLLYHLDPPASTVQVQITKFAPLQADLERFPLSATTKHHRFYDLIFSSKYLELTGFDLDAYAYYYEIRYQASPALSLCYTALRRQAEYWAHAQSSRPVALTVEYLNEGIVFRDSRQSDEALVLELDDACREVYRLCDGAISNRQRIRALDSRRFSEKDLLEALDVLVSNRVVFEEGGEFVGLATPAVAGLEEARPRKSSRWVYPYVSDVVG